MKRNTVIYTCIVPDCTSAYTLNSKERHFFRLPKQEPYRSRWIKEMSLYVPHNSVRICDLHFETKFFTSTLRQRLIRFAIPTILRPDNHNYEEGCDKTALETNEDQQVQITNSELASQLVDNDTDNDNTEEIIEPVYVSVMEPEIEMTEVVLEDALDMDIGESIVIITQSDEDDEQEQAEAQDNEEVEDNNPSNPPNDINLENIVIKNMRVKMAESYLRRKQKNVRTKQDMQVVMKYQRCLLKMQKYQMQQMTKKINSLNYIVGRLRKSLRKLRS